MITGNTSSLPSSIEKARTILENAEYVEKLPIGPTASNPGPTLLIQVTAAVILVSILSPSTEMSTVERMIRTIYKAKVEKQGERIIIELTGNGFLYNMVRIIAGTLVDVGLGKIEPKEIENIIKSKKRENAGKTLQPQGLYLLNVEYEECKQ